MAGAIEESGMKSMTARLAVPVWLWLRLGFKVLLLCVNGVFMRIAWARQPLRLKRR